MVPADRARGGLCDLSTFPEAGLCVAKIIGPDHDHRQLWPGAHRQLPVHDAPKQIGCSVTCKTRHLSVCISMAETSFLQSRLRLQFPALWLSQKSMLHGNISATCRKSQQAHHGLCMPLMQVICMLCINSSSKVFPSQDPTSDAKNLRCVISPECLVEDAHWGAARCVWGWGARSPLICWPVIPPSHRDRVPIEQYIKALRHQDQ